MFSVALQNKSGINQNNVRKKQRKLKMVSIFFFAYEGRCLVYAVHFLLV